MKKSVVITLHVVFWSLFIAGLLIINEKALQPSPQKGLEILGQFVIILWAAMSFYLFYYYLFPKILGKKKILKFIAYSLIAGLIISGIIKLINVILYGFSTLSEDIVTIFAGAIITIIFGQFGTLLRAFVDWFNNQKKNAELEKQALKTELEFLKSQINPHFMFNTLSNIDTLIFEDQNKASTSLLKLSELFRYMVYETNKDKVLLKDEITYLENLISLQRMRLDNASSISFTITGKPDNIYIAPMLFVPFIENAFKHCNEKEMDNAIDINIEILENTIRFSTRNQFSINGNSTEQKGIGLDIVRKRLDLIYPNSHKLDIKNSNNFFSVNLELNSSAN